MAERLNREEHEVQDECNWLAFVGFVVNKNWI